MFNNATLLGNLTRDIELRYLQDGTPKATSAIAVNKRYRDRNGQQQEKVMFINLNFWGKTAEIANQYLRKGSRLLIDGEIELQQWQDQNGQWHSRHEIQVEKMQMLDSNQNAQPSTNQNVQMSAPQQEPQSQQVEPVSQSSQETMPSNAAEQNANTTSDDDKSLFETEQ
ncbi:single-stranded DNA-binding protein [Candidatus Campylobacter infans]|uniref:Single-stranded DNA-binding protein n=1 Tax=Candidatus Campylobacter infans TaxID=2561898 RepID=A0A7H9CJ22_9BACT|nr:single-stranded DNA-binding protein [Candidatus Campylobacter infans]QLI06120.1 single-stranded DNA-binding protein [Candidatus Campylobacter infans]